MRYFFIIDAHLYHRELLPALTACSRQRSFRPAESLCHLLASWANALVQNTGPDATQPLVLTATNRLTYTRATWRLLTAELLLLAAEEMPELETPLATYAHLLGQPLAEERPGYSLIQQAILGSAEVSFGGTVYRPGFAGCNDIADVQRLSDWLSKVDPTLWPQIPAPTPAPVEWADEIAFALDWFRPLVEMYRRASCRGHVIVCEEI